LSLRGWIGSSLALVVCAQVARAEEPASTAERLARRWAPVYVQHVDSDDRGADRPTRIDFDGNWDATDNWTSLARYGTAVPPAAYAAPILTTTHAYLTYTLFYPRDWTRFCVSFICHDNDLESVQMVIERDAADGKLLEVRTKAHHAISQTTGADIARSADGRPMFHVEARGHGITPCRENDPACEATDGRIIYAPGTPSPPPRHATGQTVNYQLLWLHDSLWPRRHLANHQLWTAGETGPLYYDGSKRGRLGHAMGAAMAHTRFLGGVRPPWALKGANGKRGDWFLDPAPTEDYVYNPFLDDLGNECRGKQCKPAPKEGTRLGYLFKLGAPYIALGLGLAGVTGWMRYRSGGLRF
jgi:hypothetical protein